jgi:hypothetical protein
MFAVDLGVLCRGTPEKNYGWRAIPVKIPPEMEELRCNLIKMSLEMLLQPSESRDRFTISDSKTQVADLPQFVVTEKV